MIVKKLGMVAGGGFPGAGYNERKVAEGVARLMAMENVEDIRQHQDHALSVPHRRLSKGAGDVG